jgi:hypothetical protein
MLTLLRISGFALIDEIELPVGPGLTVITGETGAGKSILVDALGLLRGGRSSSELIRTGREEAQVEAVFELPADNAIRERLQEDGRSVDLDSGTADEGLDLVGGQIDQVRNENTLASVSHATTGLVSGMRMENRVFVLSLARVQAPASRSKASQRADSNSILRTHKASKSQTTSSFSHPKFGVVRIARARCCSSSSVNHLSRGASSPPASTMSKSAAGLRSIHWLRMAILNMRPM